MASAIGFFDQLGRSILWKDYRGEVGVKTVSHQMATIVEQSGNAPIVLDDKGVVYISIHHSDLILLAVSKRNVDPSMILVFLQSLVDVLKTYVGTLELETVRDNFVLIYELLDEMMDFGFPQLTDAGQLRHTTTQHYAKRTEISKHPQAPTLTRNFLIHGPPVVYPVNELFIDLIEQVETSVSLDGRLRSGEIKGRVEINCRLSGTPEVYFNMNDRFRVSENQSERGRECDTVEDVLFHHCVRLQRFHKTGVLQFIPPDGHFQLLTYRKPLDKPIFDVHCDVVRSNNMRIEYRVRVLPKFAPTVIATELCIEIPVPSDADTPQFVVQRGKIEYAPDKDVIVWKIRNVEGGKELRASAHFRLPSVPAEVDSLKQCNSMTVKYEIPQFTASGIKVQRVRVVERSGYVAKLWARSVTKSEETHVRIM